MKNALCPVCRKEPATTHPLFRILPGKTCKQRRTKQPLPAVQIEMVGNSIKEQRKEYAKSIVQPWRSGVLSKEYLDLYGTKNIKPTEKDMKNAKYVWKDTFSPNFDLGKSK